MKNFEFEWNTSDGTRIFGQLWRPESEIKAVICLVHGLGEHSSRYTILPRVLNENGYALIAFDQRGHGKSGGKRGHTPDYAAFMDNITRLLEKAEEIFPGKDRFLYGHSLGGNLVINYALREKPDIKGIIATGPWFRLTHPPKKFLQNLARWLDRFWPSFRTFNGVRSVYLSHQGAKVSGSVRDKHMHPWISVRTFISTQEAGKWALEHASELEYPALILHGGEDHVTSVEGSKEFASKTNGKSTLKIWKGLYHEIHNEPRNAEIFDAVINWLNQQEKQSIPG